MGDVQVAVVLEPDVGFDAGAASGESGVERCGAPVVVVGVAGFGGDGGAEVGGEGEGGGATRGGFAPGACEVVKAGVWGGEGEAVEEGAEEGEVGSAGVVSAGLSAGGVSLAA